MDTGHKAAQAQLGSQLVAGALRLFLFASVGVVGWTIGGVTGGFVGALLDATFIAERSSDPGAAVAPFMTMLGLLSAVGGMVSSVMWLAVRMQPRSVEVVDDSGDDAG